MFTRLYFYSMNRMFKKLTNYVFELKNNLVFKFYDFYKKDSTVISNFIDLIIYVFVNGLLVNIPFSIFLMIDFNLYTILGFGIIHYFLFLEVPVLLYKLRGSK